MHDVLSAAPSRCGVASCLERVVVANEVHVVRCLLRLLEMSKIQGRALTVRRTWKCLLIMMRVGAARSK